MKNTNKQLCKVTNFCLPISEIHSLSHTAGNLGLYHLLVWTIRGIMHGEFSMTPNYKHIGWSRFILPCTLGNRKSMRWNVLGLFQIAGPCSYMQGAQLACDHQLTNASKFPAGPVNLRLHSPNWVSREFQPRSLNNRRFPPSNYRCFFFYIKQVGRCNW